MGKHARRRRASGSLGALKRYLWVTISYNLSVIEDENLAHDLRQKASNALTQAAMIYQQVSERHELERRTTQQAQATVERFQEVVQRYACQALRRREAPAHQLARGD